MADQIFPESPGAAPLRPRAVEHVARRTPLSPIYEIFSISIHDVINDVRHKRTVSEFYRVTRWMDNERWLERQLDRTSGG